MSLFGDSNSFNFYDGKCWLFSSVVETIMRINRSDKAYSLNILVVINRTNRKRKQEAFPHPSVPRTNTGCSLFLATEYN